MTIQDYLRQSAALIEAAAQTDAMAQVDKAVEIIVSAFRANRILLVCGNGGSASDAMHIAGELVGRFLKERPAQKCLSLSANPAILTAWANDYSFETVFSRQVEAFGEAGGVLWGISTSGNSANVLAALAQAKEMGMTTIGLTGQGGGKMTQACDILIDVPSKETPFIQQVHLCLYHYICQKVEAALV
ncbi:MAG: SIS domain-containing protein [Alphaproteobacteria bacterium]|nr:SIS domain-containing protein [Alphaproteobacteria bacterium]